MPLPADRRIAAEWVLRVALIAALALALWSALHRADGPRGVATLRLSAPPAVVSRVFADVSSVPRVQSVDVRMDASPTRVQLAWLAALAHAGVTVHWTGEVADAALEVRRLPGPRGTVRALLHGGARESVALADDAGIIDTIAAGSGAPVTTIAIDVPELSGTLRARTGVRTLEAAVAPARQARPVLVVGRAGWEGSFVAAALSEAGWPVRARFATAPGVSVADSALLPIDTARYAAAIVLDSTAADLAPAIARFVSEGGGAVVQGSAASLPALRRLAPATPGARQPARFVSDADTVTRAKLGLRALVNLTSDAVPLDGARTGLAMAARREGLGRVLAIGYEDTWRWRMQGGDAGLAQHRVWWSGLAASVAMDPTPSATAGTTYVSAPRAAIVEQLGSPSPTASSTRAPDSPNRLITVLSLLALASLLAETASRRVRGAA